MLQSSLKPGLLFQRCNSSYVTRLPVIWRTVSSAERQYVPRTSTSTPSTSKISISGRSFFFIFLRVSAAIVGFPVNAKRMHARAGEKCKKAGYHEHRTGKSHEERNKGNSKGLRERKMPHPACERASCSSVIQGAAGVKISAPGLGKLLRAVDRSASITQLSLRDNVIRVRLVNSLYPATVVLKGGVATAVPAEKLFARRIVSAQSNAGGVRRIGARAASTRIASV